MNLARTFLLALALLVLGCGDVALQSFESRGTGGASAGPQDEPAPERPGSGPGGAPGDGTGGEGGDDGDDDDVQDDDLSLTDDGGLD